MLDYCVSLGNPLISFVAVRSDAVGASTEPLAVAKCSKSIVFLLEVDTATIRQWPPLKTLGRNSCKKQRTKTIFIAALSPNEICKKHVVNHCAQTFNPSRRNISWYVGTVRHASAAESRTMVHVM